VRHLALSAKDTCAIFRRLAQTSSGKFRLWGSVGHTWIHVASLVEPKRTLRSTSRSMPGIFSISLRDGSPTRRTRRKNLVENPAYLYKTSARSTAPGAAAGSAPKIVDELVTELCVGDDRVVTALGADTSNLRQTGVSSPRSGLKRSIAHFTLSHAAAEAYSTIEFFFR